MIPGRAPRDRNSAASAAHRSRAVSATSLSLWTVSERTRLRPLTWSGPRATRTSAPQVDAHVMTRYLAHVSYPRVGTTGRMAANGRQATSQPLLG